MTNPLTTQALRFHDYGEAPDVLRLEESQLPAPAAGRIRVKVHACGLNPADWALCRGLSKAPLPRGIGLEVSGTVEAIGAGVSDVKVGDEVLGMVDYANVPNAGVAQYAILDHWALKPAGLDNIHAAALPMAVATAYANIAMLDIQPGQTVVIHGAGTMIGFAAVQFALEAGAKVIATAGSTYAEALTKLGAQVTPYGEGMVGRVRDLAGQTPDYIVDAGPVSGVLPQLIELAGGDAGRVVTISDFAAAMQLGVRLNMQGLRYDVIGKYAQKAADGQFYIPVAATYPLSDWREAVAVSLSGKARGKLVLVVD